MSCPYPVELYDRLALLQESDQGITAQAAWRIAEYHRRGEFVVPSI